MRIRSRSRRRPASGQALVEFAIIVPLFVLFVGAIVQFGIIFWAQNTLTQVARDTGRWASAQLTCDASAVVTQANLLASQSSLIGYSMPWSGRTSIDDGADGVVVTWSSAACTASNNLSDIWVTVKIGHHVPVFFPFIPGDGRVTTSSRFRMEPAP